MVESTSATHNEKEIKTKWPVVEGLEAGTTKLKKKKYLLPENKSFLTRRDRVGL